VGGVFFGVEVRRLLCCSSVYVQFPVIFHGAKRTLQLFPASIFDLVNFSYIVLNTVSKALIIFNN
jgi:hypothetical protein